MTALDTSAAIAVVSAWHEAHDRSRRAAGPEAMLPAHALLETYSVLTRLPSPHRLSAEDASALLERRFGSTAVLVPSGALVRGLAGRLSAAGIDGGASYDGLVALTAREKGERLLTRDRRAVRTYEALDVDVELID